MSTVFYLIIVLYLQISMSVNQADVTLMLYVRTRTEDSSVVVNSVTRATASSASVSPIWSCFPLNGFRLQTFYLQLTESFFIHTVKMIFFAMFNRVHVFIAAK